MRYNKKLMNAILNGKIDIATCVNVQVISLDEAPKGYKDFDKGKKRERERERERGEKVSRRH
jgi:glutathione-independent formaldehyde dehydrogenase